MNLKQATYIKAIYECGSLTVAAKKLYISQPSLSSMLRQIEREIGLPVFETNVTPVRLTAAGEKYLKAAERIIAANEELEKEIHEIKHEQSGYLRLGISVTRAMEVLPLVLSTFTAAYPNVDIRLTETGSGKLESLLQNGTIDLAMAALESTSTAMVYELLETESIGILAGKDSGIAKQKLSGTPITLEDVKNEKFVCLTQSHSVRITQDKLFRKLHFTPQILVETDSLEVGRRITLESGACMLLSNIYVDDYVRQRRGEFFPLADYENQRHFYACYRKDEFIPRYVRDFISITSRVLATQREKGKVFKI